MHRPVGLRPARAHQAGENHHRGRRAAAPGAVGKVSASGISANEVNVAVAEYQPKSAQAPIYDPYAMPADALREPPESLWQALLKIGPGIVLAGSIIGSGELIVTTSLGAKYGFIF